MTVTFSQVWPFLLGYYPWSSNSAEMEEIDRRTRMAYERSVSEWLAAEVIILQRHDARNSVAEAAATLDAQRAATKSVQRDSSSRSRSVSSYREQTVEEVILTFQFLFKKHFLKPVWLARIHEQLAHFITACQNVNKELHFTKPRFAIT